MPHATDDAMPDNAPRVSVVIRSLGRLDALAELLERVLAQEHDSFEVVVVEQTPDPLPEAAARIATFEEDPRVRVLRREPLGGPGARNEGVRAARGDLVLLIDDDDLPLTDDWIAAHEVAYDDPLLVGATARHVRAVGEACPYPAFLRPFIRRRSLGYSFLKTPYTYARFDERVDGVGWLHGTNASVRREAALRAGLWDTHVRTQDEHSFAFKLQRVLRSGEYLAFLPHPPVLRRLDVGGGMGKRRVGVRRELENHLGYARDIVGRYFPERFRRLYPLYLGWVFVRTLGWVWDAGRGPIPTTERLRESAEALVQLPAAARSAKAD
jgi:glycosyltransferase involved in cell wall biosynthesis